MNKIAENLKEKNIRVTPQRLEVYKILYNNCGKMHFTADQICKLVKKSFSNVSLATIYSILELFQEKNLVTEIRIRPDVSYFDIRITPHHHFLCKKCRKTIDIDIPLCPTLTKKEIEGHSIESFRGYFYGLCKHCKG